MWYAELMLTRRAFTLVPVVALLALLAIALAITLGIKGVPQAPTSSGAYNTGRAAGSWIGPIVVALLMIPLASRLAQRRSQALATGVVGTILLLLNLAVGINVLRAFGVIGTPRTSIAQTPAPITPIRAAAASPPSPMHTSPKPSPQTSPNASQPQRMATPAAKDPLADTLDEVQAKRLAALDESCKGLAEKVRAWSATIASPPAPDKQTIADRRAAAIALQRELNALRATLRDEPEAMKTALVAAGASESETFHRSVRASNQARLNFREMAAGSLSDACGLVIQECDLLSASKESWNVKDGAITAKDPVVAHRLGIPRVHLGGVLFMLDTHLSNLQGL